MIAAARLLRGEQAAVAKLRFPLRRPARVAHRFAGEVDDRVRAIEHLRPAAGSPCGLPADARDPGLAGPGIVPRLAIAEAARQHANVVPFFRVDLCQRTADETCPAGDHDSHTSPLTHKARCGFAL